MKMEYIFVKKKDDFCGTIDSFKSWLAANMRIRFTRYKTVSIDNEKYIFGLRQVEVERNDETVYLLTIKVASGVDNKLVEVSRLQKVDEIIHRINKRNEMFSINMIWDDVSIYYGKQLYPLITELESEIRKVIYYFMIKAVGNNWMIIPRDQRMRRSAFGAW